MMRKMKVAFDVNGTLTQQKVVWLFKAIDRDKAEVMVWSTLGREYCIRFLNEKGLMADRVGIKQEAQVDLAFDDQPESIEAAGEVIGV